MRTSPRDLRGLASILEGDVVVVLRPGSVPYGKRATMDPPNPPAV